MTRRRYQVVTPRRCAGLVADDSGRVLAAAPILTWARRVGLPTVVVRMARVGGRGHSVATDPWSEGGERRDDALCG